ncbi:hypothetical protein GF358_04330 [Candidatus Woesearchaeota archaeon]|nr:hypothetical protein [Candidatus Woesearchaeota archaeon]
MTEDIKTIFFSLTAIIGLMAFLVVIGNNMSETGQATMPTTVTATGSFGGERAGTATLTFPIKGGKATGTFSGTANVYGGTVQYSGQLIGNYNYGVVSGTLQGTTKTNYQGRTYNTPLYGTFRGTVSLASGTITGNWEGDQLSGPFNLNFKPVKGAGTSAKQPAPGQTSLGYCRCVRQGYSSGSEITPFGGAGYEFIGYMTHTNCANTCGSRQYSWRER